jgi:hypothetical protein
MEGTRDECIEGATDAETEDVSEGRSEGMREASRDGTSEGARDTLTEAEDAEGEAEGEAEAETGPEGVWVPVRGEVGVEGMRCVGEGDRCLEAGWGRRQGPGDAWGGDEDGDEYRGEEAKVEAGGASGNALELEMGGLWLGSDKAVGIDVGRGCDSELAGGADDDPGTEVQGPFSGGDKGDRTLWLFVRENSGCASS